jgi:tRNA modification GTPase
VRTSVLTGEGLDLLGRALTELAYAGLVGAAVDAPVLTRARQREALEKAALETDAFVAALTGGLPPEVAATHLRAAEGSLEDLVGVISSEDILDAVFARFCVGK